MSSVPSSFIKGVTPAPGAPETPEHHKIAKAAKEFEGLLMSALWKSMGEDMKGPTDSDPINASFTDMGIQAVSSAMAASGGIGIGRMLLKTLEKQQAIEEQRPK
jgi:Rod binding domain-containing protein